MRREGEPAFRHPPPGIFAEYEDVKLESKSQVFSWNVAARRACACHYYLQARVRRVRGGACERVKDERLESEVDDFLLLDAAEVEVLPAPQQVVVDALPAALDEQVLHGLGDANRRLVVSIGADDVALAAVRALKADQVHTAETLIRRLVQRHAVRTGVRHEDAHAHPRVHEVTTALILRRREHRRRRRVRYWPLVAARPACVGIQHMAPEVSQRARRSETARGERREHESPAWDARAVVEVSRSIGHPGQVLALHKAEVTHADAVQEGPHDVLDAARLERLQQRLQHQEAPAAVAEGHAWLLMHEDTFIAEIFAVLALDQGDCGRHFHGARDAIHVVHAKAGVVDEVRQRYLVCPGSRATRGGLQAEVRAGLFEHGINACIHRHATPAEVLKRKGRSDSLAERRNLNPRARCHWRRCIAVRKAYAEVSRAIARTAEDRRDAQARGAVGAHESLQRHGVFVA
mmetsp:Transcript_10414/g.31238  ORF Transcript_10414/g.31238 Transcript_10414/m.31238 type:complete len:462 (+) Transcript_10414:1326-2711(+)